MDGFRGCHRLNQSRCAPSAPPLHSRCISERDEGDNLRQMKDNTRRSQCHPQRFALRSEIPRSTKTSTCTLGETVTYHVPYSKRKALEERGVLCHSDGIYVGHSRASNDIKTPKIWKVLYGTLKDRFIQIWTRLRCG